MSFEAIAGVAQAEAEAKELISGAELKARQMSAEAENEGKAAIEAALDDLYSVWLKGRALENAVAFYIEVGSKTDLSHLAGLADSCVCEDGVWRFSLRVEKAGEPA